MPIRIYALAKELKLDSKDLADLCQKAGVTGKGSALASLEDDEVAKVKAFLAGGVKKPASKSDAAPAGVASLKAPPPADAGPLTRDSYLPPVGAVGKIKVIDTSKVKKSAEAKSAQSKVATPEPVAPPTAPPPPVVSAPPPPPPPETPVVETKPAPTRPAPIPPRSTTGIGTPIRPAPPSTPPPPPPAKPATPKSASPLKRREPVINLARMPEVKQPTPSTPGAGEPRAQRPEIRLSREAILGAQRGVKPPIHQLRPTTKGGKPGATPPPSPPGGGRRPGPGDPPPPPESPLGDASRRRRTKPGAPSGPESERELAGMAASRADRQKARKLRAPASGSRREDETGDEGSFARRSARRLTRRGTGTSTAAPRKEKVAVQLPCTIRAFSEAAGVGAGQILKALMALGQMVTINTSINQETAEVLAIELGLDIELTAAESLESSVLSKLAAQDDDPSLLEPRPPVVTFLGHVDHGKTSLLDRIIGINVASKEAGGITQHIRAYQITKDGRKISFVDTPGHEAFTEMRARGANVTDIAVLVVAADDGIMPQTEEAISHAKAAGVPIVVALNKMDLPGAKADRVLQQLSTHGLVPSEWSGDVEVMRCSAMTGLGMDELLETLLVTADLHEYKANPSRAAMGTCLEAEQEAGRGVIAKVMVKNGTLNVGDIVVCGPAHGRVKAMYDTLKPHVKVKSAGPSMPVNITGLDIAPGAGDSFFVMNDIAQAREIAASRATHSREQSLSGQTMKVSFDQFQRMLTDGKIGEKQEAVVLNLIIRADVRGSIEAILKELGKFEHPEVQIKVLQASVGGISVADVTLAHASNAVIIGFNVIPDEAARSLADQRQVEIRRYDIIYKVSDDIKSLLEGKLKPEEKVVELGQALVKQVFQISRVGVIAGCYVTRGSIERSCRLRVFRDGRQIGEYPMESLRREKDDTKEVSRGMECGIRLAGFNDVKKDDILEAYRIEEVARTL